MKRTLTLPLFLAALVLAPSAADAAVRPASPQTLSSVFAAAQPGDVVELAAGSYGQFSGGAKSGTVTVRPAAGATASMSLSFSSASNVRVEGVTVTSANIGGGASNITIANSRFTGSTVVSASSMSNANIVFDGDTFAGIDVCNNCYEGRLQIAGRGSSPSGITVKNSVFGPGGNADGIQNGGNGVQIIGNEFVGIKQTGAVHTDALQLYGQRNTTIRGNYFHDNDVAIMAPDGGTSEVIEDNVFVGGSYRPAIQLGSHAGTSFVHNTVTGIDVFMDKKSDSPTPSTNGVIRDNIVVNGRFSTPAAACSNCTVTSNMFSSSGSASGTNSVIGTPRFVGGTSPTTFAGFALAAGSPGKNAASDGTDRGARIGAIPGTPSTPTPTPDPDPTPTPGGGSGSGSGSSGGGSSEGSASGSGGGRPSTSVGVRKRMSWKQLRQGVSVQVTTKQQASVRVSLRRTGATTLLAEKTSAARSAGTRTVKVVPSRKALGSKRAQSVLVRVAVTGRSGAKTVKTTTIAVTA